VWSPGTNSCGCKWSRDGSGCVVDDEGEAIVHHFGIGLEEHGVGTGAEGSLVDVEVPAQLGTEVEVPGQLELTAYWILGGRSGGGGS